MNCWRCGGYVLPGSSQCQQCGAMLVAPPTGTGRRSPGQAIAVAIIAVVLVAVVGAAVALTPSKAGSSANASHSPIAAATPAIGRPMSINRDGKVITVTVDSVRETAYPPGSTLRAGYALLSVMVTYTAAHTSDDASYNDWDWSAKAAGHKINTYFYSPDPSLGSGDLYADGTASGYVTFEVPTSGEVRVCYWFLSFDRDPTLEVIIRAS